MCGIFGRAGQVQADSEQCRSSLNVLAHRGPDGVNEYTHANVYIGHRRLSILDLSENGTQPMISSDQEIVIAVNGEIYNFPELRKELETNYQFGSRSDSEIILHGYREWGIAKLLEKIDGMYAFVIYDKKQNKLYLARDRYGIKPLYFSKRKNEILWSSELKAIEHYYKNDLPEIDKTALYDFLTYLYIPAPKSLYKDVFKLEPATYLDIDLNNLNIQKVKYWDLKVSSQVVDESAASKKLRELINDSIDKQMMSDVPVGFFLSGGIDSSGVVAGASEKHKGISTFSIGFEGSHQDETPYAKIVADKFRTKHWVKKLNVESTKEMFSNIKSWYDEPFADTSCYPTFLVSKFARENVTVVLTGDGGDEVFGGYKWYRNFIKYNQKRPKLPWLKKITTKLKKGEGILRKIINVFEWNFVLSDLELYTKLLGGLTSEEKEKYRKGWGIPKDYDSYWYFRKYYRKDLPLLTRLQYLDFHTYLPDDILTKVDRVSMAVSLECRVPLLEKNIIEFVFSLDESVRNKDRELKYLLKLALKNSLPEVILNKKKEGFSIPLKDWRKNLLGKKFSKQEVVLKTLFEENRIA
ncbi:MAG: asparagine synthase (glutamine-hydrolyzing) [Halobacteriovoraceae bacterium]|nr:asparagine synthase (glutamine-hydrolyzing) [Halobacteriovoraceae bacterium]